MNRLINLEFFICFLLSIKNEKKAYIKEKKYACTKLINGQKNMQEEVPN